MGYLENTLAFPKLYIREFLWYFDAQYDEQKLGSTKLQGSKISFEYSDSLTSEKEKFESV